MNNYITRIALIATLILSPYLKSFFEDSDKSPLEIAAVSSLLIILGSILFFQEAFNRLTRNIYYRYKNIYSDFIYESIKTRLEYIKADGSEVSVKREDRISQLSLRSCKEKTVPFEADAGSVLLKKTSCINSSLIPISNQRIIFKCSLKKENIVNGQHYSSYSTIYKNAFTKKTEFWIISTTNFCRFLEFSIVFPTNSTVKSYACYKRNKSNLKEKHDTTEIHGNLEDWRPVDSPSVIKTIEFGREVLMLSLLGLPNYIEYKIEWSCKKTS